VAGELRHLDCDGGLRPLLEPRLTEEERATAEIEGWILGVK
jgi:hypothetical protein